MIFLLNSSPSTPTNLLSHTPLHSWPGLHNTNNPGYSFLPTFKAPFLHTCLLTNFCIFSTHTLLYFLKSPNTSQFRMPPLSLWMAAPMVQPPSPLIVPITFRQLPTPLPNSSNWKRFTRSFLRSLRLLIYTQSLHRILSSPFRKSPIH